MLRKHYFLGLTAALTYAGLQFTGSTVAAQAAAPEPAPAPAPQAAPALPAEAAPVQPVEASPLLAPAQEAPPAPAKESSEAAPAPAAGPMRDGPSFAFAYPMTFTVGDYKNFIGDPGFRGIAVTGEWPLFKGLRLGGSFNYVRLSETKARETYEFENAAINGKLYNYSDAWNMGVLVRYRFLEPGSRIRPFLGTELGVSFLTATTLIADFGVEDSPTGFLFVAEAGTLVGITKNMAAFVALRYNLTTASFVNVHNPSFLSLQIGLSFGGAK